MIYYLIITTLMLLFGSISLFYRAGKLKDKSDTYAGLIQLSISTWGIVIIVLEYTK